VDLLEQGLDQSLNARGGLITVTRKTAVGQVSFLEFEPVVHEGTEEHIVLGQESLLRSQKS
jgi:hypothetical protein